MGEPLVFTTSTRSTDPARAARDLAAAAAGKDVRAVLAYCTVDVDAPRFARELRKAFPRVPTVGTTLCQQVATDAGAGFPAGAMMLAGEGFRVGAAAADVDAEGPLALGERLARDALANGGLTADRARFVVVHATPGVETPLVQGLARVMGPHVAVVGGSAADNDISGQWWAFADGSAVKAGASVLVCDWPWKLGVSYQSGYVASGHHATVTRAEGRRIHTLGGRPAAEVYESWTGTTLPRNTNVLGVTTLRPLGVVRGQASGLDLHVLVHPERVHDDGSISTFAEVSAGETVVMMESNLSSLQRRAASVARLAMNGAAMKPEEVAGQFIVYCAGCSLALGDGVEKLVTTTRKELPAPFVMPFTFGEQGNILRGRVDHGNLMCVALMLGRTR